MFSLDDYSIGLSHVSMNTAGDSGSARAIAHWAVSMGDWANSFRRYLLSHGYRHPITLACAKAFAFAEEQYFVNLDVLLIHHDATARERFAS